MGDLRARSAVEFERRRQAILAACETLCADHEYEEITLTDIAQLTALSRPSMYNYYQRKEEVFLDLLKIKCGEWADTLQEAFENAEHLTAGRFCAMFTETVCARELTLKLLSMHFASIEKNSSVEAILAFRQVEERIPTLLLRTTRKLFPEADEMDLGDLVVQIMIYVYGIYPTTHLSRKLTTIWEEQGIPVPEPDMRSICLRGMTMLVDGFSAGRGEESV